MSFFLDCDRIEFPNCDTQKRHPVYFGCAVAVYVTGCRNNGNQGTLATLLRIGVV